MGTVLLILGAIYGVNAFAQEKEQSTHRIQAGSPIVPDFSGESVSSTFLPYLLKPIHNPNVWHPLTEEYGHHHGVNPADYVGIFGQTLADYLAIIGGVSYPWQTPYENIYKHQGYVWLYDQAANGCELFNIDGNPNCVTHALVQVHSIGTPAAAYTRFHSHYAFVRICSPDGTQCGIVATGGYADYNILHAPYKESHCELGSDPPGFGDLPNALHQPPYRSNPVEYTPGRTLSQFWNSLGPNAITLPLFPDQPNNLLGLAWLASDSWAALNPADCDNAEAATIVCADGSCDYNHSRFYIFSVRIHNLPAAPFVGWTNRWGHVVGGCSGASVDCVPLVVTAGVPSGTAWLNRQVNQGSPDDYAPAQEFDVFDANGNTMGWITMPTLP